MAQSPKPQTSAGPAKDPEVETAAIAVATAALIKTRKARHADQAVAAKAEIKELTAREAVMREMQAKATKNREV